MAETERTLVVVEDDANIADLLDRPVRELSLGQRVRCDLGAALQRRLVAEVDRRREVVTAAARFYSIGSSAWSWAPTTTSPNRSARERSLLV